MAKRDPQVVEFSIRGVLGKNEEGFFFPSIALQFFLEEWKYFSWMNLKFRRAV